MSSADIHAKFFPQAKPICAFTRADLRRMARALHRLPPPEPTGSVNIEASARERAIVLVAAIMFGVSVKDMVSRKRTRLLVYAREYSAVRMRGELKKSDSEIGRVLRRDHKTIANLITPKKGKRRYMAGRG